MDIDYHSTAWLDLYRKRGQDIRMRLGVFIHDSDSIGRTT